MTRWERAGRGRVCGLCERPIAEDAAMALFVIPGLTRELVRCASCADEPAPESLPERVISVGVQPRPIVRLTRVREMARDWKQRAAEREQA